MPVEELSAINRPAIPDEVMDVRAASGFATLQTSGSGKFRLLLLGLLGLLPSFLSRAGYRLLFGYKIGKRVRIGFSIIDARQCVIEDDVRIGHFNVIVGVKKLSLGDHVRIGHLNVIRGGDEVKIGRYCDIIRLNELNSIPDPEVVNPVDPTLEIGPGTIITTGHKIDFTDRVEIGRRAIIGGRNSSLWTHNRQRTQPITIGEFAYVGSEVRLAPGALIPARCVVGIGSVIVGKIEQESWLIAGVPAKPIKELSAEDRFLVERKTRPDLPDDI
jgi:acetyltransferase-like isoleucine patch superfamily enzyme